MKDKAASINPLDGRPPPIPAKTVIGWPYDGIATNKVRRNAGELKRGLKKPGILEILYPGQWQLYSSAYYYYPSVLQLNY